MGLVEKDSIKNYWPAGAFIKNSKQPDTLVWHYTRIDLFYDILATDGFWATQSRFSNDSEELETAKNIIARYCEEKMPDEWRLFADDSYPDSYMVSLCENQDLLAQWRGYCVKSEGVSIGLDFTASLPAYLCARGNNEGTDNSFKLIDEPLECWKVDYFSNDDEDVTAHFNINELDRESLPDHMPFIKHDAFEQEAEYRIAVVNKGGKFNDFVQYRLADGLQIPYVCLKFGIPEPDKCSCPIKLHLPREFDALREELKQKLSTKYDIVDISDSTQNISKLYSKAPAIIVSQSVDDIQHEIFDAVYKVVDEWRNANSDLNYVKVFCEGHLPIRKIIVGNSRRVKDLTENLRHFCKHNTKYYWLRDVDVDKSEVPYRTPIVFNDGNK